jgi:uncharacterized protein with von Willebrand factor type A (vWA) domain
MIDDGAEAIAIAFARVLRGLSISAPIGCVLTFAEALGALSGPEVDGSDGVITRGNVYWAARTTLVRRPEDVPVFDRAFSVFFDVHLMRGGADVVEQTQRITVVMDDGDSNDDEDDDDDAIDADEDPTIQLRFSAAEVLRHKDFGAYSDDELRLAQQMMTRLRFVGPPRRSLRSREARRNQHRPDLRRTVRASLRASGEPIQRFWKEPGERIRPMVLLLDVSGSMEPYARALLRFVQAAVAGRQRVEAFAMGTRLTRVTKELGSRDPDKALRLASERVTDWSGGTRLGECLRRFNDEWGVRGMARGAIVVVLSDGWDRGDPVLLAEQMRRLQRITHNLVWVNPLKVTPGYAPLARGMAAALPFVDHFVEGHSVAAMEELARVISGSSARDRRSAARHA